MPVKKSALSTCQELLCELRQGDPPQSALLIPPDADQIKNPAPKPVPDTVFGHPRNAWPVVHGDFLSGRAPALNENREKAMPAVEGEDAVQSRAFECAQATARIPEIRSQNRFPRPARDARGDSTQPVVLAIDPHAGDEINAVQFGEKPRQISGVILQVAVERPDNTTAAGLDTGPERGALAAVARQAHAAHSRIQPARLLDPVPCFVAAGVIHEYQFKGAGFLVQRPGNLARQRQDVVLFIKNGDDDRDVNGHEGSVAARSLM